MRFVPYSLFENLGYHLIRFGLLFAFVIILTGCGFAWNYQFYRPAPDPQVIPSLPWGIGTVFKIQSTCVWVTEGTSIGKWRVAATIGGVLPVLPVEVVGRERPRTKIFDLWITLIPDNDSTVVTYDAAKTYVRLSSGEKAPPRLVQISRFNAGQTEHGKITRIDDLFMPVNLWSQSRFHLVFVKPSEDPQPVTLVLDGIVESNRRAAAVELPLQEDTKTYVILPGFFFKSPLYGDWPTKACRKLLH